MNNYLYFLPYLENSNPNKERFKGKIDNFYQTTPEKEVEWPTKIKSKGEK